MQNLQEIKYDGIRVLTTKQIAEAYGVKTDIIGYNFRYNKERYVEGKHYIMLEGQALREFKLTNVEIQRSLPKISKLYLWTEKGALLHAKSLNTDKAWEVYDYLVDFYFRAKERTEETQPAPVIKEEKKEELPQIDDPIRMLTILLRVAEDKGIKVKSFPFKYHASVLHNGSIGIKVGITVEKACYELAWELAHAFIHYDGGDLVKSSLSKDYNAQAGRAAEMIIKMLNVKMGQI